MRVYSLKEEILEKVDKLKLELKTAKRYHRSSVMGQLIATKEILYMIDNLDSIIECRKNTEKNNCSRCK